MGLFDKSTKPNINPYDRELSVVDNYIRLETYYESNQVYQNIAYYAYLNGYWTESMKALRNPVHRSVEFFASKMLPGNIDVITQNQSVKEAIEQFHKWSNLDAQKTVASRTLSLLGDLFWKVVGEADKVYLEIIHPAYVTDFETDSRGYLTEIRIEIPQVDENGNNFTYIEYWDKENNYWAIWNSLSGGNVPLDQLEQPVAFGFISDLSIDFIPIVYAKFSDTGGKRGHSCVAHALEKITESDRQATRLHELLFRNNQATWVVNSNKVDSKTGKFQSAPLINGGNPSLKDNQIIYMPGLSDIKTLIPQINYADALAILTAMCEEIASDLPEIRYFDLKDSTSGKALRLLMGSATDRALEARNNIISALKRCDEMALTIGQNLGLFTGLGSYENSDFEHTLTCDDIFPLELDELAIALRDFTSAGLPLDSAMKKLKFTDEEISSAMQSKQVQDSQSQANFMNVFNKGG